jgi:protoporphyrinogen oxidase
MNEIENTHPKSYECCIIGVGAAGLGVALELVRHGVTSIAIIDKNKSVGGLARTNVFDGVRFDIGPHRFFTKNKEVNKIWHGTLEKDFRSVSRLTRIFYKNKYFKYPIKPLDALIKLGPIESIVAVFSFLSPWINRKNEARTFEDWIVQKLGRKLYETFFKTYTEKIWGIPCSQIGAEWAAQRIKGLDALELIKNALIGRKNKKIKTLVEEFDYPVLGTGQMYEAMRDKVVSRGADIILGSRVIRFNRHDNTIDSIDIMDSSGHETSITARHFFSSIPLAHFFKMLNPTDSVQINNSAQMLRYRDHITVHLLVDRENVFPDQWIYVHSPDIQMARVANYNNFSKAMVSDKNKTALSVEYFVFKDKGLWNESDKFLADLAINELDTMGLIKNSDVEKSWVVRDSEAYPIYYIGFLEHYNLLRSRIDQFVNLYSIGRAGMHKYNNMDHSLMSGILAARNYLKLPGSPYILWDINIDAEYLENAQRSIFSNPDY